MKLCEISSYWILPCIRDKISLISDEDAGCCAGSIYALSCTGAQGQDLACGRHEMGYSDYIIFLMEIVGTVAFAISGTMVGIQKHMDLFGVNVLGVTTAVGGGLIRDLILNMTPPAMFRNKVYALTAIATSSAVFLFVYMKEKSRPDGSTYQLSGDSRVRRKIRSWMAGSLNQSAKMHGYYDRILFLGDTLGLGIFTVMGSHTAVETGHGNTRFLVVFVGVLTGVGGGMIRDVLAGNLPFILVKHIYAVASLAGALVYTLLLPLLTDLQCMLAGAVTVVVIRVLAAHYRWNLPRIPG